MKCMIFTALLLLASTVTSWAEDDGFRFPNLNPFSRESTTIPQGDVDALGLPQSTTPRWGLPSWELPSWELPSWQFPQWELPKWKLPQINVPKIELTDWSLFPKSAPQEPTAWEKFNTGRKSFWGKTRNTFLPWTATEVGNPPGRGGRQGTRAVSSTPEPEAGFWGRLFGGTQESPASPQTANEFLALPKVEDRFR